MYPHIYYSEYGERYEEYMCDDDMWWFWNYLNNFDGTLEEKE